MSSEVISALGMAFLPVPPKVLPSLVFTLAVPARFHAHWGRLALGTCQLHARCLHIIPQSALTLQSKWGVTHFISEDTGAQRGEGLARIPELVCLWSLDLS